MNPPGRMTSMSATLQIDSPVYETQARHINHCRYVADAASIRVTVFCGVGYFPPVIPLPTLSLCDFATFLDSIDHVFQCRHLSDSASLND